VSTPYFIIIADRIDSTQRTLIHAVVKENATTWWHQFLDAWIVGGHTARFWRDELKSIVPYPPSAVLVLSLPSQEMDRKWAGRLVKGAWLRENYTPNKPLRRTPSSGS
jgi:hypothetical protein